jgi:putative ABC transport system permease protein
VLLRDYLQLTARSVRAHRLRSVLTGLGIAVGIAAVVLLTSIGEGIRRYVLNEFTQFGTTVISVQPGRTTTHGANVGVFGSTRPLTLDDAQALARVPGVTATMGVVQGNAEVRARGRTRRVTAMGVGADMPRIFRFEVAYGRFLPPDDPERPRAMAALGATTAREIFGDASPLGALVQVGGLRFRVVGVMAPKGNFLGFDLDDAVYVPTALAMQMFDREGLMEVDVLYGGDSDADTVARGVERMLTARHGRLDFTVTTQQQMLETLGSVLSVLTFAVGALGSISLFVGAIGILTIMTIAVRERTGEIGLLRALGARGGQVLGLFLGEAVVLSALGGVAGLVAGVGLAALLRLFVPALPVHTPWSYALLALVLSAVIGLLAGALPARRAARLDPVEALRAE